jgi:hypothetical protein
MPQSRRGAIAAAPRRLLGPGARRQRAFVRLHISRRLSTHIPVYMGRCWGCGGLHLGVCSGGVVSSMESATMCLRVCIVVDIGRGAALALGVCLPLMLVSRFQRSQGSLRARGMRLRGVPRVVRFGSRRSVL